MESAAEGSRNADRAGDADVDVDGDLITGLSDDVLLHILELVADATDAARMGALSRRWLGLWARVPALRFAFASRPAPAAVSTTSVAERCAAALELERYVSFVNGVLARRSTITQSQSRRAAIESLAISCTPTATGGSQSQEQLEQLMPALIDAAQGWILYAVSQHGLKRFILDLDCHDRDEHDDKGWKKKELVVPPLLDDELIASPPRLLETMRLALGGVRLRLRLPAAAMEFALLRDLSLERIRIPDGDGGAGHLLGRLVSSSCCPCLQKLRLSKVWLSDDFKEEMLVKADVLSELWVEEVYSVSLELRTPSLRVLHIDKCFHRAIRIAAPRLEQLALFFQLGWPPAPGCLEIEGESPRMRRLKLALWSHRCHDSHYDGEDQNFRYGEAENLSNTLLLNHYSYITCFEVTLYGRKVFEDHVDLIQSRIPHLPHITSLTVNVSLAFERHDFGVGVANLLTRFRNLRHLSLHLPFFLTLHRDLKAGLGHECNHQDYWTLHEISMDDLQEVELSGLTGTDCELWFMKAVLTSAKGLRKVAISFNPKCWQHHGKMHAIKHMLLDEGMQTSHPDAFILQACMNL